MSAIREVVTLLKKRQYETGTCLLQGQIPLETGRMKANRKGGESNGNGKGDVRTHRSGSG
jgi:hypothetical protein